MYGPTTEPTQESFKKLLSVWDDLDKNQLLSGSCPSFEQIFGLHDSRNNFLSSSMGRK